MTIGTNGPDNFVGDPDGLDIYSGRDGDDTINGGGGYASDILIGGSGNDLIIGGRGRDTLWGDDGDDTIIGGYSYDEMDGGEGVDTVSYEGSDWHVSVSLATGRSRGGDGDDDETLSGFENLIGSAHNDTLLGDSGANKLYGMDGRDFIYLGSGDEGFGGVGNDTLIIGAGDGALATIAHGGEDSDAFHIEGNNVVANGGTGNDVFYLGSGANGQLNGNEGLDVVVFGATGPNDDRGVIYNGTELEDRNYTISGVEIARGTDFADVIIASAEMTRIEGRGGNDAIAGEGKSETLIGGAGADTINGAGGFDFASYEGSAAGVAIDLAHGFIGQGDAEGDRFTGIEGYIGSDHQDAFWGDANANWFIGGKGIDVIETIGSQDTVEGGEDNDFIAQGERLATGVNIDGGLGNDVLAFASLAGATLVGGLGDDVIAFQSATNSTFVGGDGRDTLSFSDVGAAGEFAWEQGVQFSLGQTSDASGNTFASFENLTGTGMADTLWGDLGENFMNGGAGWDAVSGLGGNDTLSGGVGNDTLVGGEGSDTAFFNGNASSYSLQYSQNGDMWVVNDKDTSFLSDGVDYLQSMEHIRFLDYTADLVGSDGSAVLTLHKNGGGGHSRFEHDKAGVQAWTQYENTYDANSQLKSQVGSYRNGGSWLAEWDVDGGHSWSSYTGNYNAQGQQTMQVGNYDDGRHWVGTWDTGNSNNWTDYTNNYTSDWRLYEQVGNYDNGNKWVAEWDLGNTEIWSARTTNYDAQDRALLQVTSNDNGTFSVTTWDVANAEAWAYRVQNYDAVWGLTGATLIPD